MYVVTGNVTARAPAPCVHRCRCQRGGWSVYVYVQARGAGEREGTPVRGAL